MHTYTHHDSFYHLKISIVELGMVLAQEKADAVAEESIGGPVAMIKQISFDQNEEFFDDDTSSSNSDDEITLLPAGPPKPLPERHNLEFTVIMLGASALAFNAGFVNGVTIQFRDVPVSHVTGMTTQAGLSLGNKDFEAFAFSLCLIVCFVFGAGISGSTLKGDSFHLGVAYGPLFLVGSLLFLLAFLGSFYHPESNFYFYFASMACGLQNSLTTKYSGSIIRTTHMTGAATDIGLTLGKICMGDYKDAWKLLVLGPLFVSFLLGGLASIFAFRQLGHLCILVNVLVFFSVGVSYSIIISKRFHVPLWKAMLGLYTLVEQKVIKGRRRAKSLFRRVKNRIVSIGKNLGSKAKNDGKAAKTTSKNDSYIELNSDFDDGKSLELV